MSGSGLIRLMLMVCLALAWAGAALAAPGPAGRVVSVADGDTLTVSLDSGAVVRVRLFGVDAPEQSQPFGAEARAALSALAAGRRVRLETHGLDRYGRTVARVFTGDGGSQTDVGAALVERGAAWVYREFDASPAMLAREGAAQRQRRGLWALGAPLREAPWTYRREEREGGGGAGADGARGFAGLRPDTGTGGRGSGGGGGGPAPFVSPRGDLGARLAGRPVAAGASVVCGAKHYCREMTSCAEARAYLTQCHVGSLDGDGDGRPCEWTCPR